MKRIVRGSLAVLVLLAAAAAGWGWLLLRHGLAQREGSATIGALAAPVEVRWDAWGVPHLTAGSGTDLAAATGWIHANDRLEQMELGRRAVSGRLAEVIGAQMVDADVYLRRLRLRRAAERIWDDLGGEGRAWLTAYAAGVNAWIDRRAGALPPLFTLLRIAPEPWTPVDSLGFSLLMAEDLSFWQGRPEEQRFRWLAALGRERLADLLGEPELHVPRAIEEAARRSAAAAASARPAAGRESGRFAAPGSNNWALAPSRSALGAPLVANDPHLGLRLPGTWYEVHLRAPDYQAMGMSLPGVPGVIIGTNGAIAWALTNTMLDDHDLFFERLDERGERVARGDRWQPITREPARIAVKGGESVEIELAETDRGVLLPADAELGLPPRSLAWSATYAAEPPADPLGAFLQLARARRAAEVPAAVGGFVCPAQNLVVADRDGHLLITVLGRVPVRRRGDGRLPSPGWDPSYGWELLLPSAANPSVVDPPEGLLITANNDLRGAGHDRSLVAAYDLPARAARIRELLSARDRWRPAELAEVQADVVSLHALEVLALLAAAGAADGEGAPALRAFAGWDGSMAVSGPAALFALLERALVARIFGDELALDSASGQDERIWLERALRGEMLAAWFDDVSTPAREGRAQIVASALAAAWSEGAGRWGDDVARWSYGEIHPLLLAHPLGELPILGRLWNLGPLPQGGSETTVAAFGGGWRDGAQPVAYGPSMRSVAVPSDPDQGLAVLPAGQAGHPLDPHYRDQWALYRQGRLRPVAWSEEAIERSTVTRLTLVP